MLLHDLFEGLTHTQDENGRHIIDYKNDDKRDDKYFAGLTKSVGVENKVINLHKDDYSTSEIGTLKQYIGKSDKGYQPEMLLYTAMPLQYGPKSDDFLDALKRRNEEKITFNPSGLEELMKKGAFATVQRLAKDRNQFRAFNKIIVVPIPSGKSLTQEFANHVIKALQMYNKPVEQHNLLAKSANPKYGTIIRGRRLNPDDEKREGAPYSSRPDKFYTRFKQFRPESYNHMLGLYKKGQMSEQQLIDFYNQRMAEIANREQELAAQEKSEKVSSEIEALIQETKYLEKFILAISKRSSDITNDETSGPDEIKKLRGLLRRLTYDRFEVVDKTPTPSNPKERTLVVLVDDNVDSSKSLIDAYRVLFKQGVIHLPNYYVAAIALHQIKQAKTEEAE